MLFNSLEYLIFLPVVFSAYWMITPKYRWKVLLVASYFFYMSWNTKYIVIIIYVTLISFFGSIFISKVNDVKKKKLILLISICLILLLLIYFKYFNFLISNLSIFFSGLDQFIQNVILPVGISFITFQAIGYMIDVYRGNIQVETSIGIYATFISFFPQLVAGPIERSTNLLPQIKESRNFSYDDATYGLKLMAWGLFKKIVIADFFAIYVDKVFNNVHAYTGFSLVFVVVLFAFQIYCDFSGYSDMAIGSSKLFKIDLMTNFKSPYFSKTIKEFWRRWHISLSTWFKDYVYIPLGGNRVERKRGFFNTFVTFFASGIWHGANWTYILWGGYHGTLQIVQSNLSTNKVQKNNFYIFSWMYTFILVCISWALFRAASIQDFFYVIFNGLNGIQNIVLYFKQGILSLGMTYSSLLYIVILVLILLTYDYFSLKYDVIKKISSYNIYIRWIFYSIFITLLIICAQKGVSAQFVYFQF